MTIKASSKGGVGSAAPFHNDALLLSDYVAGVQHMPSIDFFGGTAGNYNVDIMHLLPFVPKKNHTFLAIGLYSALASNDTKKARLGLYSSTAVFEPNALITDFGEITFNATPGLFQIAISEAMTNGVLYHLGVIFDNTVNLIRGLPGAATAYGGAPHVMDRGIPDLRTENPFNTFIDTGSTYGALPANPATLELFGNFPLIYLES